MEGLLSSPTLVKSIFFPGTSSSSLVRSGRWECPLGPALSAEAAPHCTELYLQESQVSEKLFKQGPSSRKARSQVTGPRSPYPEKVELLPSPYPSTRQPSFLYSQILASRSTSCGRQRPVWGGAVAVPTFCRHSLCRTGAHLAKWMMLRLFVWVNNLSSGAQGPSPTRQSTFCTIGDRLFWERPRHCCEAEEKLILSLESIPAWEERSQHLKGVELGHAGTWLLQPEFRR